METAEVAAAACLERIRVLEAAIRENQTEKSGLPDCPCWGNAPQWNDRELYAVLDGPPGTALGERLLVLKRAVQKHRQAKGEIPTCTCWTTSAERIDAKLYAALDVL